MPYNEPPITISPKNVSNYIFFQFAQFPLKHLRHLNRELLPKLFFSCSHQVYLRHWGLPVIIPLISVPQATFCTFFLLRRVLCLQYTVLVLIYSRLSNASSISVSPCSSPVTWPPVYVSQIRTLSVWLGSRHQAFLHKMLLFKYSFELFFSSRLTVTPCSAPGMSYLDDCSSTWS